MLHPANSQHSILTRVASWHLWLKFVVLILQRFDVILLAEEEIGGHRLAHNQHTGQKGQSCHLISPGRAATEKKRKQYFFINACRIKWILFGTRRSSGWKPSVGERWWVVGRKVYGHKRIWRMKNLIGNLDFLLAQNWGKNLYNRNYVHGAHVYT